MNGSEWCLILLCVSMVGALGGGPYEHVVLGSRVARWAFRSWFREPLGLISFVCRLAALSSVDWP
jgi:hypothetical protein